MFHSPARFVTAAIVLVIAFSHWTGVRAQSSEPTADLIPIPALQGGDEATPRYHDWVDTAGIVTGITDNGFYLQDPAGDGDSQTSDGIFVYTQSAPRVTVGECVLIRRAFVDEFYAKTELSRTMAPEPWTGCSEASIVPVPLSIAQLGVEPETLFERFEGMVVQLDDVRGLVQGPTKRFDGGEAEIAFIPDVWAPYLDGARVFQWQPDAMGALMYISNALQVAGGGDLPELNWGDRVAVGAEPGADDAVVGILDYNFGKYQFMPLPGTTVTGETQQHEVPPAESAPLDGADPDSFTVCSFNLLGLGTGTAQYPENGEYRAQMRKRALAIAHVLDGCTIIGLQETGSPADAANLARMLADDFGLDYDVVAVEGPGTASLEFPLTNSLLARRDRVRILNAELRQGCSRLNYDVKYMPGVCQRLTFGLFNRPPLVVDLEVLTSTGVPYPLTVIVNHWKSKGGDETVNVVRRTDQAKHVASLVQERLDAGGPAPVNVIVLGDLNDYYHSGPVDALRTGVTPPLAHTYAALREQNRYTYIFNGGSQVLDHMLVTESLLPHIGEVRPLHINADFAYPRTLDSDSVHHSSDHDPVMMRISPTGRGWLAGTLDVPGVGLALDGTGHGEIPAVTTDANGEFRFWNLTPGQYRVTLTPPSAVRLAVHERLIEIGPGRNDLGALDVEHLVPAVGVAAALQVPGNE